MASGWARQRPVLLLQHLRVQGLASTCRTTAWIEQRRRNVKQAEESSFDAQKCSQTDELFDEFSTK
jgi:hypothetical protein